MEMTDIDNLGYAAALDAIATASRESAAHQRTRKRLLVKLLREKALTHYAMYIMTGMEDRRMNWRAWCLDTANAIEQSMCYTE